LTVAAFAQNAGGDWRRQLFEARVLRERGYGNKEQTMSRRRDFASQDDFKKLPTDRSISWTD